MNLPQLPANEPALVAAAVTAALTLAATFGLHLTAEQIAGVASIASIVTAFFVRQAVTPNAKAPATPPPNP